MIIFSDDIERVKNTVLFFVLHTKHVGITKLCKLLYFSDIDCYIKTGFKITELEYRAQERGPVPTQIWAELQTEMPRNAIKYNIQNVVKRERGHSTRAESDEKYFVARKNQHFNSDFFTENELEILQKNADKYKETVGTQMSEESHLEGKPWEQTWNGGIGKGKIIDFDLDLGLNSNTDNIRRIKEAQKRANASQEIVESL